MMRRIFIASLILFFLFPQSVFAHAFGTVYRMPIPLHLYLFGGAGALVISFFLIGYFANSKNGIFSYPTKDIARSFLIRFFTNGIIAGTVRALSVFLLAFCVITGFFGTQIATYNFNMTFFWVIFFVGFPYLVFLFGDVWRKINPWKVILEWVEEVADVEISGFIKYPQSFSYYPAFFGFFLLICLEIVLPKTPFALSAFLLLYTNYAFFMAILFGKKAWEEHIDFFSIFFRLIGSISFVTSEKGKILLRPPFVGAIGKKVTDFSLLLFILFMLSSTAADGFMGTSVWFALFYDTLRPLVLLIGINAYQIMSAALIFLSAFLFLLIYYFFLWIMKLLTKTKESVHTLGLYFAFSLIPIAFAYHFAHYFVYLIVQGQDIIPLLSDPLGSGWNLFGTSDFIGNPELLPVNVIWHTQVIAILLGHIAGVFISHIDALRLFPDKKRAFLSQFPLLVLMVIYTVIGLWILAQPITGV